MDEILCKQTKDMLNVNFDCSCGKRHKIEMKHIFLQYVKNKNKLEKYTDKLTNLFYGE